MGRPHPDGRPTTSEVTIPATTATVPALAVLDRQVDTLLDLGYPALAGLTPDVFADRLGPLREVAAGLPEVPEQDEPGHASLVLVVTRDLVDPQATVPLLRLAPKGTAPGVVDRNHGEEGLAPYRPIEQVALPRRRRLPGARRRPRRGVPRSATRGGPAGRARPGRTPLTIEEGIAVVTHAPQLLEKNRCFMLSGSRRGDRRVPAMWISARAPKLGWCWDGNPHDWLGVASAGSRVG